MGILSGNPKDEPMHYGEVSSIWVYLSGVNSTIAAYQTFINHTGDGDLKKFIEDKIRNEMKPQVQELEALLKENGIALPPAPPERPIANLESIPVGARFNDSEIAMTIAKNIATGLVSCSQIMGEAIREDIATIFGKYHVEKATYGLRLLRIQKEKGWLVPPPLNIEERELAHV
ncbi:hypothetical protein BKP37_04610 [Anaerobacillus alkalilacustris]|uniref:DUF3231 domain-containing protein n=1 Tax=Anaerobacillus alkalilacustris TaxID=393763 RepID=A0A1S2LWB3_9BACI|nr:DUF3231 family protein [Anaerobacillus alkalilacustris]OIJ16818.1 hypothetical protein BKP37_04610 [Anaerobacillus alkalilacustris]